MTESNNNPITDDTPYSPERSKDISRGVGVDMSSEAVTRRLDIVDELRELAEELANAKRLGPVSTDRL